MTTLEKSWDVIVIGAGLGGLSAAAHLARAGQRVLVLEQHVFSGGYAHDFPRKVPGTDIVYHFDVALHQTGDLDAGRPMHRMLESLGVLERLELHRFDVAYRTRGPEHDLRVPADADAYEELLCSTYPEEAEGVRSLFARLRAIDRPAEQGGPSEAAMETMPLSLQQLMDEHVRDPRVQSIFATLWGYVGLLPRDCSAFLYARMWATFHLGGTYYIAGGGRALADAFVAVIEEHGGKVVVRRPVEAIRTAGGRVVGVTTRRHGDFDAPVVVSNAAAPLTFHTLLDDPDLATADLERVDSLPLSLSIHQAYVGLRGDAAKLGLEDRVDFVNPSYDFEDEARALAEGDYRRQGYLLGNHNLADPGHHPPGRSIVHVSTMTEGSSWLDLEESEYRERKAELEDYLIGRLEEEIPDVRERIEICETGTPHTMRRYSQNPGGAIYGYAHGPTSHSIFRPSPRTSVPGLYLAGAWTFPAAGFSGTMGSGRNTAKLVMQDVEAVDAQA